jgi:type I restriction enzyme S subunit
MSREMKDSGVEWIGEIPEDWDVKRIKHAVVQMGSGTTPNSDNSNFYDGNIAWIQSGDLYNTPIITKTSKTVTEQAIQRCSALKIYHKPYIVIAMYGASVGNVSIASIDACTNQACCIIKPNDNNDIDYLKYWLEVCKTDFIRKSVGGGQPNISQDKVREQTYLCPSPTDQQQIVHFLDRKCTAIDTAIEKTKKSIEKLEEYKKAVITKAVTKGIDPNAKMKDSGVEWIGEIPEDWDVKKLRTYFSRRINKNTHLHENNLLSLSYGRIIRKNIDTKEGLLPESFDGYNIVEDGDIVIRGTDLQNDHRSLRTGLVTERGIITSAYMTLRPKEDVNSTYYHYLLHCYDISKVFYSMGGGLRQSLDYWEFIRMPVLHPTDREQEKIVSYIKTKCTAIDNAIEKKKKAIEKWEEYKKSLIYYAVTGKIDCRNEVIE